MVRDVAAVIWGSRRYFVPVPTCPLRMLCTGGLAAVGLAQSDNLQTMTSDRLNIVSALCVKAKDQLIHNTYRS